MNLKKIIFIPLFVFVISIAFSQNTGSKDTCFYLLKLPADMDIPTTPHFDTTIVRSSNCSVHVLRLGSWGTFSTYQLSSIGTKLHSVNCSAGEPGIMDITDLPTGTYRMYLMACGNGGGFKIGRAHV